MKILVFGHRCARAIGVENSAIGVENLAISRRKMTNPQCPFCGTESSKHEAGRCLDHWVEAIRKRYDHVARGHPHNLSRKRKGFFYIEALVSPFCADEGLKEYVTKYSAHKYSTDMNHAITLMEGKEWVLFSQDIANDTMLGTKKIWFVWEKQDLIDYCQSGFDDRDHALAEAKDPATAICRAYLEVNND